MHIFYNTLKKMSIDVKKFISLNIYIKIILIYNYVTKKCVLIFNFILYLLLFVSSFFIF